MGSDTTIFDLAKERILDLTAPLTLVADAESLAPLRTTVAAGGLGEAFLLDCPGDAALPMEAIPQQGVVIVEIDPRQPASLARIKQLRRERPGVTPVAALAEADLRTTRMLVREGVADVITLPFNEEEILETLLALTETGEPEPRPEARRPAPPSLAPLTALTRAIGGQGATTIASHLAAALAETAPRGVCVIDLDVQTGRMAEVFGLTPRRTLTDLLDAGVRIDPAVLGSVAIPHGDNIHLISAPRDILPIEAIDESQVLRVIDLARRTYDHVVIDLPANLTNWTLAVLARAGTIVPVVQQSLHSLHHTRRMLDLFASLGLDTQAAMPVVNRVEKKLFGGIGLGDVRKALGRDIAGTIANEPQALAQAQDRGLLLTEVKGKSPMLADIRTLAQRLAERTQGGSGQ